MLPPIDELTYVAANEQNTKDSDSIDAVQTNNSIEQKSSDELQTKRSVVINESQPLARYSVLYLGTAIPAVDQRGIDSIQEPISKRYPVDGSEVVRGIEAWLSIDDNGLQIQFASDPSVVLYYPIRSLVYCASIRFATRMESGDKFPNGWRFVPLDSPNAILTENAQNPPLFAVTCHRTRHLPMDECHCFVAKTKQIAMALVGACSKAYQATDSEQDCSKVPLYFKVINDESQMQEIDDEIFIVPALDKESISDYPINNKSAGFFYKTDQVPIDSWQLWENPKHSLRRSSSTNSCNSTSRSSHHHRRLSSIASIPETDKPSEPPTINNLTEQLPQSTIDPYALDPNVLRIEHIKDNQTGRDVYIRWRRDPSEQAPPSPLPIYDFNTNYQSERKLPNQIQQLVLDDRPRSVQRKKSKKEKHKHRDYEFYENHPKKRHSKSHKKHRDQYPELVNSYTPPPTQPAAFIAPFEAIFSNIQSNSTPFWFYAM